MFAIPIIALMLLTACATNVSVDYDDTVRFSELKTYTLLPKSSRSTDDKRLNSPLIDQRIVNVIKSRMAEKGYRYTQARPDMKLEYQIDLKQEIASDDSGVTMVIGGGGGHAGFGLAYAIPGNNVQSVEIGRLTIDVLSGDSGKLLWRGTSSRRIYDASTPERSKEMINDVVSEILAEFPPG